MKQTRLPFTLLFLLIYSICSSKLKAASIVLHTRDAVAWLPQQTLQGSLIGFSARTVTVHQDAVAFTVAVNSDSSFTFSLTLHDNNNCIWVQANDQGSRVLSDTVTLQLGYHPTPVIKPYAIINKTTAFLKTAMIQNPWKKLQFHWTNDARNPVAINIAHANDSNAYAEIPAIIGVYYFNLMVTSGRDTARFQTYVTKTAETCKAFNIDSSYAAWIDDAVMYEITPYAFVANASYDDITAKLPQLKQLGINTIWLQPVFKSYYNEQGYDIIDYFSLRDDLGGEAQLRRLIRTAKSLQIRVLFDFVPNHTSIYHPYATDCATYKTDSHYYNFYQHTTTDGALYSSQYHTDEQGFVYYFWNDLVNLNYSNPEVQQWMIEACKYWIEKFNIDGYRFDAVWGVNARQPDFGKQLQLQLKVMKPDLLLLAEDKGAMTSTYQKGFDAAYDWTADTSWISQWSWQYDYDPSRDAVIFNFPIADRRGQMLRNTLFDNGDSIHTRLHFIENNDLPRFIAYLGLDRTKMAASLTFALPGIPLIYNGQEAGVTTLPSPATPTFKVGQSIQSQDRDSLFPFYQQLIAIRAAHPCLRNHFIENIFLSPAGATAAFHRGDDREDIVTVSNMDASAANVWLDLRQVVKKETNAFTLTDLVTKEIFTYSPADLANSKVPMNGYSTRILLINSTKKDLIVLKK